MIRTLAPARRAWLRLAASLMAALPVASLVPVAQSAETSAFAATAAAGWEQPPARLSETGLHAADGSVDPRNRPFVPQYPLWTDGADKSRWVRLPDGGKIDATDIDAWTFPPGTTFWKEFAWNGRKVETRMIRRGRDGTWIFASYVWADDQSDAVLAPVEGVPAAFELSAGKRHSIPAVMDCSSCHGSSPSVALGFTALQLSDDRDPLAPHTAPLPAGAVTLRTLIAEQRLSPKREELVAVPPRIRSSDPVERAALGYLSANCGGCHNARGPLARLDFSLMHDTSGLPGAPEPGLATTVGTHGRYVVPGVPEESSRIVAPGAPERSALLHRMRSRRGAAQMPPIGTVLPDDEGIALIQRWISGLGSQQDSGTRLARQ